MNNCNHPYLDNGKCMTCHEDGDILRDNQYWKYTGAHYTEEMYFNLNSHFGEYIKYGDKL